MSDLKKSDCVCPTFSNDRVSEIYDHLTLSCAPPAMGYVPYQHWCEPYDLCRGLAAGTIFPDLHKPFCGKGGMCR